MYNSYARLPFIPYRILEHLALTDENIWKMMKYNDYNALNKPNLSMSEKLDMIWKNGRQDSFSVFFTNLVEDAISESRAILKIYDYYVHASDLYTGTVVYAFDFLYGGQMSLVDLDGIPVNRGDVFINSLMTALNGAEVDGIGKMTFYNDMSAYDSAKSILANNRTFSGVSVYISVLVGDGGEEEGCGS